MLLSQIAASAGGVLYTDGEFNGVAVDSRKIREGNLFVCFRGARVDGHDFISQAVSAGAAAALCERRLDADIPQLVVDSSVLALQQFAADYRRSLDVKITAVTGSVGKTSTKEFIYAVLSRRFPTHKTYGNMNSETGLPITLLGIKPSDRAAVVELGMSALGEIKALSDIANPDVAVITNIGFSHIESLGSQQNILRAKLEIIDGLKKDGVLILNADDQFLRQAKEALYGSRQILTFGIDSTDCDVRAESVCCADGGQDFILHFPGNTFRAKILCEGRHNVYNALAAAAVGFCYGLDAQTVCDGLLDFRNAPMRQDCYDRDGFYIIEDCYNASPASVRAAADILSRRSGGKIAVLGDMLELGDYSESLHRQAGSCLRGVDSVIAFGNFAIDYISGAVDAGVPPEKCLACSDASEAGRMLYKIASESDNILVKASRGMRGEDVLKTFFALCEGEEV